ncbi:unnamed protein product [Cuscuta campestris]|uniref:NTF2 domain-containing protein n=1 Tax=Cuscuta campestris TaxID=132261 RepID=A0A484NGW7_9ASTE|nr:unnamed protein product [Cuscuta campestris]
MAAETAAEAVPMEQPLVSPQVVGNAFVQQYYHILHHSPELVYRFYQDGSKLGRPEEDGSMSITTTMLAINEKILSLNYADITVEIKTVDAQESFKGGVTVLVTGCLTGQDTPVRNFTQSFFLAPQDKGFFVLNDMFRYVKVSNQDDRSHIPMADTMDTVPIEQNQFPAQETLISDESTPSAEGDEVNGGEVFNPHEDQNVPIVEEEEPVAEVVNEPQDVSAPEVVEPMPVPINEAVPKKSYAKIVIELKESAATFSPPPAPVNRNPAVKHTERMHQQPAPAVVLDSSASVDNLNNQEGEAEGYSIYIRGLPMHANKAMVEEVFKNFGPIKDEGIQVRSHRGFCFGFVEFEEPNAVQKAIEASPVAIGGRQAVVEEKRSTSSRGNNRRFLPGRGSMYRSEGVRGRGYGGGGGGRGGHNRGEFNSGRNEFNNHRSGGGGGGTRGGSSNRGNDGYYWSDHGGNNYGGGRVNRDGGEGMPYGNAKNMAPRVPATA